MDLNRNFPVGFGDDAGSSPDPCSQTFRGTSAFSEPELANMREYIRELNDLPEKAEVEGETPRGRVAYYQDVHSYGQLILYPWGHREGFVDDIEDILTVGTKVRMGKKEQTGLAVNAKQCLDFVAKTGLYVSRMQNAVATRTRQQKQDQTKFYDLRRGITEDFQRLAKFQSTKKSPILSYLRFCCR